MWPLPGSTHQQLRTLLATRWDQGYKHFESKFEHFYRFEKLINMASKKKQYDWKANAFLPYPFAMSEQSAAIKWMSLFTTRPYVTVKARHPGLAHVADRRQALIDWRLSTGGELDMIRNSLDLFRMSERYGKGLGLCVPHWDPRELRYRSVDQIPTALGPIPRISWKTRTTRDYKLRLTPLDLTDTIPQPGFKRINGPGGVGWIMWRYWSTQNELLAQQAANLLGPAVGGEDLNHIHFTNEQPSNEYRLRRLFINQQDDVDEYRDHFDRNVEVIHYYGKVPPEILDPRQAQMEEASGLDPTRRLVIFANKYTILMNVALPWDTKLLPFIEMDCVPEIYDFYGKGKVEPIEHLTYVGNEIVNMRLDNVKMAVHGIIGVDGRRMPHGWKKRLVAQPWGALETKGPPNEIVSRLNTGDVTQSSYQEQQQIFTLIQEAIAVNETLMGAPGQKFRTLGEHRMKAETASTRLQFELVGQADQLLGFPYGLSGFILGYDRQYLPLTTYISVINPENPDDFLSVPIDTRVFEDEDHHFVYMPTGATEGMNNQARRFDLSQLLDVITPMLPQLVGIYGFQFLDELIKVTLKTYNFDSSRFIPRSAQLMGMQAGMGPGAGGMQGGPGIMAPGAQPMMGPGGPPGAAQGAPPQQQGGQQGPPGGGK
jgi:hypothetical protein